MGNKRKATRELLRELCIAHSQALKAREAHKQESDSSDRLLKMYDKEIRELEGLITANVKSWLIHETAHEVKPPKENP
jgi:protein-tyrosine-phosphatase